MSVAGISSSSLSQPTALQPFYVQRRLDIQQLAQALQSGDLAGAQAAYATLSALRRSLPAQNASGQSGTSAGPFLDKKVAQDFNAIGKALQSGDLEGAQQAFATFLQDTQGTARGQRQSRFAPSPEIIINLFSNSPVATPKVATPVTDNAASSTPPPSNSAATSTLAPITSTVASPTVASTAPTGSAPATTATSAATSTAASPTPEIIVNLDGESHANSSPEIIVNLGGGNNNGNAGPELTVNFSDGNGGSNPELTLNFNNGGSNGSSAPELVINLGTARLAEIAFNFGNGPSQSGGGTQIDIVA
jgi:hypothetical protein